MAENQPLGRPARYRRFLYHLTTKKNIEQIRHQGLVPYPGAKSRFAPLAPEADADRQDKVFLLPVLNGRSMRIFLYEWWHGAIDNIVVLRTRFESVTHPLQSHDLDYDNCEVWTHSSISPESLEIDKGYLYGPHRWVGL